MLTPERAGALEHLAECLSLFVQNAAGCAVAYDADKTGEVCKDMKAAHVGRNISEEDYTALVMDAATALIAAGVKQDSPQFLAVAGALTSDELKRDVITSKSPEYSEPGAMCEAAGGMVAFHAPVTGGRIEADGIVIETGGAEPMALKCRLLVNAAGLAATDVIASVAGFPAEAIPPVRYAKGNYFTLAGRAPFSHLIYPVPVPGGLGVHLTLDLGGQAKFGPDVEWVERIAYEVDPKRGDQFYDAIRRYWPGLADGTLQTFDSQIDQTTGTIKLRALFPNDQRTLFPNQFVNIRLLLDTHKDVVTMSTAGVQRGVPGTFAYLINADSTVSVRPIQLGVTDGDRVEVLSGLSRGDRVVIDGGLALARSMSATARKTARSPP